MTHEEHTQRHKLLHREPDELVADMLTHTGKLPTETSIFELLSWSNQQTIDATEKE